jgi:1-deoxy-D-xylulose-5-phosphate reductoisomerase
MKKIILLGSSGSIGTSTCKVVRELKDQFQLVGLAVAQSTDKLLEQVKEFNPKAVTVTDEAAANKIASQLPSTCKLYRGNQGLVEMVRDLEAEIVVVAIIGTAGLQPALAAVETGKHLAVASKEILVMAGEAVTTAARKHNKMLLPVDSEHNAIFQCLLGEKTKEVKRLILTASGGPFRTKPREEFESITVAQALKHPTWSMGTKITIDSSTLFNKGLEMIEAKWLFDLPMSKVDVIVHPQSIVHSMVEFIDHSTIAQLSVTDMCFPIQYALTYPERTKNHLASLDLAKIGQLTFEAPDPIKFPALRLAREAGDQGGTLPAVLNAANEVAVDLFLKEKIKYPQIWEIVEQTMSEHQNVTHPSLEVIIEADQWAREIAQKACLVATI